MTEQVRASHILVKSDTKAKDILARLNKGENFSALAQRFSDCPSGKKGGDLGWFTRGMMVREFEDAAFGAAEGAVVGPVKTQFGHHIIKVTGRK